MGNIVFDNIKNKGVTPGMIVVSTAGHDMDRAYLVIDCKEKMAATVNGTNRTFLKPKMKRVSHLKQICMIKGGLKTLEKIVNIKSPEQQNAVIRKTIDENLSLISEGKE